MALKLIFKCFFCPSKAGEADMLCHQISKLLNIEDVASVAWEPGYCAAYAVSSQVEAVLSGLCIKVGWLSLQILVKETERENHLKIGKTNVNNLDNIHCCHFLLLTISSYPFWLDNNKHNLHLNFISRFQL